MKYTIQTKQKNYLAGLIYKSVDDVINAIIFYDLIPPFKVFDETKKDITDVVLKKISEIGYKFVDKKKVASLIPNELQELMNRYYKNQIKVKKLNDFPVKLVTVKDIKSLKGFYELWDAKGIAIGTSDKEVLFFDITSSCIYKISKDSIDIIDEKKCIIATVSEFIKYLQESIT